MRPEIDIQNLVGIFEDLPDPRRSHLRKYRLGDIVVIAVMGCMAGCDSSAEIADWARHDVGFLKTFLPLKNGVPSHDTFSRVFKLLDPVALEASLRDFFTALLRAINPGEHVAIDGKTLRGSFDKAAEQSPLHLVSAWLSAVGLCLAQVKTSDKSNEITAIPQLLDLLKIRGRTVTIDAMGCQTAIAEKIVGKGANYLLALKDNHPTMIAEVETLFRLAEQKDFEGAYLHEETDKGHGRIERRRTVVLPASARLSQRDRWPKLRSIVMVISERIIGEKTSEERRYYLSSLGSQAPRQGNLIRSHWSIENSQHWVMDVEFREDASRVRRGAAPENFALVKRFALALLNQFEPHPEKKQKTSVRRKRKICAWNQDMLLRALIGAPVMR